MKTKLPIVSVYLTAKQAKKQWQRIEDLMGVVSAKERLVEIRIDGRINYHDLVKIQKMKKV